MDKKMYRKKIKEERDNLALETKKNYDQILKQNFLDLPAVQNAKKIFAYLKFGSEISTMPIIQELLKDNKEVYIPWIDQEKNIMKLTRLTDPQKELEKGFYGILEMKKEYLDFYEGDLDVVLTPGLVFDKNFFFFFL